jgi:hypothetical protein
MIQFYYYVFTDCINHDDFGDEQVSIYSTRVESESRLIPDQAIDLAEDEADWKIAFGEGDDDFIDKYVIDDMDLATGVTAVIADGYEPS